MPTDADVYLCGPDAFLGEMRAALTAQGVPAEHVASEVFGTVGAYASGIVGAGRLPAPHPPDGRVGTGPTVSFVRSNITVGWDARVPEPPRPRRGLRRPRRLRMPQHDLSHCESTLVAGEVEYTTDPLEPPPAGRVLVCCSTPHADLALDL